MHGHHSKTHNYRPACARTGLAAPQRPSLVIQKIHLGASRTRSSNPTSFKLVAACKGDTLKPWSSGGRSLPVGDPLEQLTLLISGSQVRALVRPPGSFRAQTFAIGLAFIARKCRFSRSLRVSESVSDWQMAGFWRPVSALRISVPGDARLGRLCDGGAEPQDG